MEVVGRLKGIVSAPPLPAHPLGAEIIGTQYTHLFSDEPASVIHSRYVTNAGTGLVHTAPAHGHEDYEVLTAPNLKCPVDDDGCFFNTHPELNGKAVLDQGTDKVVDMLSAHGSLFAEKRIKHRYPYDWKSKKPIIIRATPQWFADLSEIKPMAMKAMDNVDFYPPQCEYSEG
jgi:isoleucyl-tRNA synthetase